VKVLRDITPTAEQLTIIRNDPQLCIIRGCLGCGKTSTAIFRLQFLISKWERRRRTQNSEEPIRVLVLTFNKTLRGYIKELVQGKVRTSGRVEVTLSTLAKWSQDAAGLLGRIDGERKTFVRMMSSGKFPQGFRFLLEELEYVSGRFPEDQLVDYIDCERAGRGLSPKCDKHFRHAFLNDIVYPYQKDKRRRNVYDWNDCCLALIKKPPTTKFDIIVCDEVQDFSANEMRAILAAAHQDTNLTFVLDGAQRIYPKSFMWKEVELKPTAQNFHRLKQNFRNTREIATFIAPIFKKIDIGGDEGTLPNPTDCTEKGPQPIVLEGKYSKQLTWVKAHFLPKVDLANESVAFLKPLGGNWFADIRKMLAQDKIDFVELTRQSEWPQSDANVALCTMHSAKGLEFDHVIILGLNSEVTPHGVDEGDATYEVLARLFAMACGRARQSVVVGYKAEDASSLIELLDPKTFNKINL